MIVGEAKASFLVHKSLLEASSSFFRAALSEQSGFREVKEMTVPLLEENPEVVRHFVQWLYKRNISIAPISPGERDLKDVYKAIEAHHN